jgi:CPA2 family monovalent cation:H+ antiporter-2
MNWTIAQIASVVLCAMGSGLILSALGHSPILGYIIAGVLLGPSCLRFITDSESVMVFSEMGILFLMFAIGLGLSFEKVKNMWKKSMFITAISTLLSYIVMLVVGYILKIPQNGILLMTFCVALSSTAVTVKSLNNLENDDNAVGESTFGILISQDIAAIIMVLIIGFIGTNSQESEPYRIIALIAFILVLTLIFLQFNKFSSKLTSFIKKHVDMLSMLVFGTCIGSGVLAEVFGLSASFGAFIAGLILGNSGMSEEIKKISSPIEEILLMTFFLSIGLLVDLKFVWNNLFLVLFGVLFVTIGKTIINIMVLRLFKFPMKESFIISVLLAHIGEFSFMLSDVASKVGIIDSFGVKFLVSLTALSLFFSPFWLSFAKRCASFSEISAIKSSWQFFAQVMGEFRKTHVIYSHGAKILNMIMRLLKRSYAVVTKNLKRHDS